MKFWSCWNSLIEVNDMVNVIELKNVSKRYKSGFEFKNIDLEVKKGVITGFIG